MQLYIVKSVRSQHKSPSIYLQICFKNILRITKVIYCQSILFIFVSTNFEQRLKAATYSISNKYLVK